MRLRARIHRFTDTDDNQNFHTREGRGGDWTWIGRGPSENNGASKYGGRRIRNLVEDEEREQRCSIFHTREGRGGDWTWIGRGPSENNRASKYGGRRITNLDESRRRSRT